MQSPISWLIILMLIVLSSCKKTAPESLSNLSYSKKAYWSKYFNAQKGQYYQGSIYKQEIFDRLIEIEPENEYNYRAKSITHSKIGDYHIAFPLLEKSKALDPAESLYYYAWLLTNLYHDYERAILYLEEYDALTPDQLDYAWGENVYHLKGLAQRQLGRYEEAINNFTRAIESEGDYPDTYDFVYRGICYLQLGDQKQAIQDFKKAIDTYDKCSMAFYYQGVALDQMGKHQAAKASLEQAKALLEKGYKLTDPYKEVVDEVHLAMVEDYLKGSAIN